MIKDNVAAILSELPSGVTLVAAAKTRTAAEILEAIDAGVKYIGENYVQEAQTVYEAIKGRAKLHFIGHLQKNKVKKAVGIFDLIETVDSIELAQEIDKRCRNINKVMPILIEINSGREAQKTGVFPENAAELIKAIAALPNIRVEGLMTMGPLARSASRSDASGLSGTAEDFRPYFKETKKIFDQLKLKYLSMGMTASYKTAIEEGANMVRIGTAIFGERPGL